jgi:hypothetical protein
VWLPAHGDSNCVRSMSDGAPGRAKRARKPPESFKAGPASGRTRDPAVDAAPPPPAKKKKQKKASAAPSSRGSGGGAGASASSAAAAAAAASAAAAAATASASASASASAEPKAGAADAQPKPKPKPTQEQNATREKKYARRPDWDMDAVIENPSFAEVLAGLGAKKAFWAPVLC